MATSTRITRSKGESDRLSLPMRSRSTRRDATSGRNGGTTLSTSGREHQQQMPTQTPHLTQSSEAVPEERTATAPMLPPGLHRPLTPRMSLPASPASSLSSSAPLFQEDGYGSTSEDESEVTFTHGRCNGTSPKQHAKRTSTPTPSDYMTQGDPDASPPSASKTHDINNEFLGTNNFFMPDGSNRQIHQIQNKVFHAGYLDNGNNAYLLELPALENMLNTRKFLMDEMSGQFYAVYGNSYQRMSTKPMLQCTWATGELIYELAATRQAFSYTGLTGSTPPLATGTQPTASTSQQPDDLLPRQPAPKTVQYQPPNFRLTRPIIQLKIPPHLSAPTELKFERERLTPEELTEENCCNLILPRPFHPKFAKLDFKDPTRCLAVAAHFLIRKELFNSKCTQLHVAKVFAVAEKKLHLAISGRKYDPGKKASKRKRTSAVKTSDPKPSTSQDKSASEQQPQDESISEQQPQDEPVPDQPQDDSVPDQPQDKPVPEQQQDEPATKQDKASDTLTSLSSDDELPDYGPGLKIFTTKDPSSIPKKPRYSLHPKTE